MAGILGYIETNINDLFPVRKCSLCKISHLCNLVIGLYFYFFNKIGSRIGRINLAIEELARICNEHEEQQNMP